MTYYKYAEKKATDFVDWGKISSDVNTDIQKALSEREERRRTLDKEYMETMKAVGDSPQVDAMDAKPWVLNATNQAAEFLRQNYELMRKGKLKPADFTVLRTNVYNNMTQLYSDIKTWEAQRKGRVDKVLKGEVSAVTEAGYDLLENYSDLSSTMPVFDARTGYLFYSKAGKTGSSPTSILSSNNFFKLNKEGVEVARFDLDGWAKKRLDAIGDIDKVLNRGGVGIEQSKFQNPEWSEARTTAINSLINTANTYSAADVLVHNSGQGYKLVWDEPKNDKEIRVVMNRQGYPEAQLTEKQLQEAKDIVGASLDKAVKVGRTQSPQTSNKKGLTAAQLGAVNVATNIVKGDLNSAIVALRASNPNVSTITRTPTSVTITYNDGKSPLNINHGGDLATFLNGGGDRIVGSPGLGAELGGYNVPAGTPSKTYKTPNFSSKSKQTLINEVGNYFDVDDADLNAYISALQKDYNVDIRRSTMKNGKPAVEGYGMRVELDPDNPAIAIKTFLEKHVPGN
jgi:hypothetical protein